jgi:hypothetical protein
MRWCNFCNRSPDLWFQLRNLELISTLKTVKVKNNIHKIATSVADEDNFWPDFCHNFWPNCKMIYLIGFMNSNVRTELYIWCHFTSFLLQEKLFAHNKILKCCMSNFRETFPLNKQIIVLNKEQNFFTLYFIMFCFATWKWFKCGWRLLS